LQGLSDDFQDRVSIMHQSHLHTRAGKGDIDISLFYRFLQTDKEYVHSGRKSLIPLLFIEFTKAATKTIENKLPQAALYSNHLLRLMKFSEIGTWVPLFGIIMSENDILFRIYSPSLVGSQWKIAEIDVMTCPVSNEGIMRLVHVMVGWTKHCREFLCSPSAKPVGLPSINSDLLLRKRCNIVMIGNKMFKSFDYRDISRRSYVDPSHRRDPAEYRTSDLAGVELIVNWTNSSDPYDRLQILSYDAALGTHRPSVLGHFTKLLKKLLLMHPQGIVHGDLRFSNVIFSEIHSDSPPVSTIIDFDYSGLAGERVYPPHFNLIIDDGARHPDARPNEFLRLEHDIAAVKWMCEQYQPRKEELRSLWLSCILELEQDMQAAIEQLEGYESEPLEPVTRADSVVAILVASTADGGLKGTGSPDSARSHYK
jgi:hypothetical protein